MEDLALLVTMDSDGQVYLEAEVPDETDFIQTYQKTKYFRLPMPRSVCIKLGKALLEAADVKPPKSKKLN